MATKRAPSPRYRTDDPAPVIQLQQDDVEILWHVFCNRVIDAKSIYMLFPNRSEQVISRRLNRLRKGPRPFLNRLPQAVNRLQLRNGSDPQVYAIATLGAQALRLHRGIELPEHRWAQKNRELKPSTIQHDVSTSRFMAMLYRDAVLAGGDVRILYQQEFTAAGQGAFKSRPSGPKNTLRTVITNWHGYRGEQGTSPDRIFAFTANGRRQYFFLEVDEGTETIVPGEARLRAPSFWRDTSLLRKFVIYASAFETKAHVAAFDIPVFRVITVAKKPGRVTAMQEACRKHLKNVRPGLFLFADWERLAEHEATILTFPFYDSDNRHVALAG
jgi:hypothetical protein